MIGAWRAEGGRLVAVADAGAADLTTAVWVDLEAPTPEEEARVEAALSLEVPTREDMLEIEPSSRVYREGGALYLTAQIIASDGLGGFSLGPATFVIQKDRLVTVHYHHPGSFTFFADWAARHETDCRSGFQTFLGLMEAVVDRLADVLEAEARGHAQLSKLIFGTGAPGGAGKGADLSSVIAQIGLAEDRNAKLSESLATLRRILGYLSVPGNSGGKEAMGGAGRDQLKSLLQDVRALSEIAGFQAERIRFQLDATLGVINIRQSDIIKIFSVVAFVFLPPTLIASIYGMNFEHMPELAHPWGYPAALGLMVISAVLPWLFFRWRKWL